MHFEYPWVFLFGALFLVCERKCPLRIDLLFFPHVGRIAKHAAKSSLAQAFKWMGWSGLIVALASPVKTHELEATRTNGRDMVLVLDASRSMDDPFSMARKENKFATLKRVVGDFIAKRHDDRLGIVLFGEYAYIASPLTFDHETLKKILPHLEVGIAGERTAIYDALAMAVKLFKTSDAKSKVIVLITDGRNTAGKIPLSVAMKLIEKYGIKVYTIGIGNGTNYDPRVLKRLAKVSGGRYFSAEDPDMLEHIYRRIDRLETSNIPSKPIIKTEYFFHYPLYVAAMSLLIYLFLMNRSEA